MPLGESMISSLKSNKSIRLDKTSRFRKTPGGYEKNKTIVYDFPEATPELLESIKSKAIRERKILHLKTLLTLVIIVIAILIIVFLA